MPDDGSNSNADKPAPKENRSPANSPRGRLANIAPAWLSATVAGLLSISSMWAIRSCDKSDEILFAVASR